MPKAPAPNKFDLKRAALMTNTTRAQNIDHHKRHAEADAHRVAVIRAQNRNTIVNEYNNLLAATAHGPLRGFAVQRKEDLKQIIG